MSSKIRPSKEDITYELVYWETIPANCFPFQDSDHHVFLTTPPLRGGTMLHRFNVADGTEYSGIYTETMELASAVREHEDMLIKDWILNGIR